MCMCEKRVTKKMKKGGNEGSQRNKAYVQNNVNPMLDKQTHTTPVSLGKSVNDVLTFQTT